MKKKYVIELESGGHMFVLGPEGCIHIGEPDVVIKTVDGIQIGDVVINAKPYIEPDIEQIRCAAYEEGRKSLLIEVQKAGAIKVGNEVKDDKDDIGVCTEISYPANSMYILYPDGTATDISLTGVTKTGNDFPEVIELLKKMRGETDSKPKAKKQSKQIPGQMSLF